MGLILSWFLPVCREPSVRTVSRVFSVGTPISSNRDRVGKVIRAHTCYDDPAPVAKLNKINKLKSKMKVRGGRAVCSSYKILSKSIKEDHQRR